jgi:hypothetical protein
MTNMEKISHFKRDKVEKVIVKLYFNGSCYTGN